MERAVIALAVAWLVWRVVIEIFRIVPRGPPPPPQPRQSGILGWVQRHPLITLLLIGGAIEGGREHHKHKHEHDRDRDDGGPACD
jgi:hypothetical protein